MESDFKDFPKKMAPKDYWGQVKRTVHGKPVGDEQIDMIVQAIREHLQLAPGGQDNLLDLGCGNGALSALLFDSLSGFHGVDYSDFLVSVAKKDFERAPHFTFEVDDVLAYVRRETGPARFTKALCYGCFSYFREPAEFLRTLAQRFPNVQRVYIGNLPDLALADRFYKDGLPPEAELRDIESKIGVWRTTAEFEALAAESGWKATVTHMPAEFYAAHYRYDILLTRGGA